MNIRPISFIDPSELYHAFDVNPDLSRINTIILDIDGTILQSNNVIQPGLDSICSILQDHGIHLLLASARPIISILNISKKLNIFNPVVGLNGSIIADRNKIFYQASFKTEKIIETLLKHKNISLNYYNGYDWFVDKKDDSIILEEKLVSMTAIIKNSYLIEAQKILIIGNHAELENINSDLASNKEVDCSFSKINYLEVNPKNINKVTGIKECLKIMNLNSPFIMTIGDGENDIPMLKEFELGISMGNAPEVVKNISHYALDTNDNHGLVKFLACFCIARGFE